MVGQLQPVNHIRHLCDTVAGVAVGIAGGWTTHVVEVSKSWAIIEVYRHLSARISIFHKTHHNHHGCLLAWLRLDGFRSDGRWRWRETTEHGNVARFQRRRGWWRWQTGQSSRVLWCSVQKAYNASPKYLSNLSKMHNRRWLRGRWHQPGSNSFRHLTVSRLNRNFQMVAAYINVQTHLISIATWISNLRTT